VHGLLPQYTACVVQEDIIQGGAGHAQRLNAVALIQTLNELTDMRFALLSD